jgi:lambda family phage portal protein
LQIRGLDRPVGRQIELRWAEWSQAVGLAEKLRTMRMARAQDGEAFALLGNNPGLRAPVQLDVRLIEADQVASAYGDITDPRHVDGIRFDAWGNPQFYEILPEHPGGAGVRSLNPVAVPAELVCHFFLPERPGQRRGIPETTAALPLFAQLRRWTLAVLAAAETAADLAAIMRTQGAPDEQVAQTAQAFERIEFERRALMTLPAGWDVTQMKAEQPTSTYREVKAEIINEIGRALSVPFNVIAGNSSGYNFSSGRLDHQPYHRLIGIERARFQDAVLDPIFRTWFREARLAGILPSELAGVDIVDRSWYWDGFAYFDPSAEASAQETRLRIGTSTLADEWAIQGEDWQEKLEEQARILAERQRLAEQYGITWPDAESVPPPPEPTEEEPAPDLTESVSFERDRNGRIVAARRGGRTLLLNADGQWVPA